MSTRTWVDVGDLLAWRGVRTGIPRVVGQLVARYSASPDVRFFVYSDRGRVFREVDRAAVIVANRPLPITRQGKSGLGRHLQGLPRAAFVTIRGRLSPSVKQRIRRLEAEVRIRLADFAVRAFPVRSLIRLGTGRDAGGPARSRSPFERGDRILVLGAGWATASLQQALAEQKETLGVRVFQLLYDLTPILLPQCFGPGFSSVYTRYFFEAVSVSDGLVSISKHSRTDALRFCKTVLVPAPRIEVFRLGDERAPMDGATEPVESLAEDRFILSVGTIESRKNHFLLYQVWKRALELGRPLPDLVIVGRSGWAANDTVYAIQNDPAVKGSIHLLDEVNDAQLEWLYKHCLFTVYPSLYEGWGLPIAESLARGTLCLASSSSAMREVAGDLIEYFSPYDAAECLRLVERYSDGDTLEAKARQIRAEYPVTSWDAAYEDLEAALDRLAGG